MRPSRMKATLRTADQLHARSGFQTSSSIPDDTRDHPYAGVHSSSGEHGETAVLGRYYPTTPGLVDQFFNGSTGENQYGETDFKGPWNSGNGLHTVQSEIKDGEGLDVTPYNPKPGTETTSPVDSTPVGE